MTMSAPTAIGERVGFDGTLDPSDLVVEVGACSTLTAGEVGALRSRVLELGAAIVQQRHRTTGDRAELLSLGRLFGSVCRHARSDPDGIAPVTPSMRFAGYMGASCAAHPFHTDGAYDPEPPKIVSLHCERPACTGGLTQLASGKRLYDWLASAHPDLLPSLFAPDALTVSRQGETCTRAVLSRSGDRIALRYRADHTAYFPRPEVEAAMGAVQRFLEGDRNVVTFLLEAGQILVVDNCGVLHARTAFPPAEPRKLNRLTFAGDSPFAAGLPLGFAPGAAT
jgi:alpha-ketoglutarate-dependent taurine dioxygenase